jgi:hypothetical protein
MKWSVLASYLVSFGGALLLVSSAEAHHHVKYPASL